MGSDCLCVGGMLAETGALASLKTSASSSSSSTSSPHQLELTPTNQINLSMSSSPLLTSISHSLASESHPNSLFTRSSSLNQSLSSNNQTTPLFNQSISLITHTPSSEIQSIPLFTHTPSEIVSPLLESHTPSSKSRSISLMSHTPSSEIQSPPLVTHTPSSSVDSRNLVRNCRPHPTIDHLPDPLPHVGTSSSVDPLKSLPATPSVSCPSIKSNPDLEDPFPLVRTVTRKISQLFCRGKKLEYRKFSCC